MAIKVPDNFRPSDYGIELSIPKPDMECKKNEDGSFSLYVRYTYDGISDIVREAAREIYDKMEAELIDELLRLNGYVPERTCENLATRKDDFACSVCECEVVGCMVDDFGSFDNPLLFGYCPNCGAKVVE